jgi:hypothetical protein
MLSELALLLLIAEIRMIAEVTGAAGVSALYLLVRGAFIVMPFGALIGAFAPVFRRHRTIAISGASLALFAVTGLVILLSLRRMRALDRTAEDLALGIALLVVPVTIAAALFVRWTPLPPPKVELANMLETFE